MRQHSLVITNQYLMNEVITYKNYENITHPNFQLHYHKSLFQV